MPQQIPALVELFFDGAQLLVLLITGQLADRKSVPKVVLSLDELVDAPEDVLVVHRIVLPRPGSAEPCLVWAAGEPCPFLHPGAAGSARARQPVMKPWDVRPAGYVERVPLTRKRVIAAAIELIEAAGAEAVSMRRLATELGCGLMSLYDLVPSKAALLDAVADEVMSRVTAVPKTGWDEQVRAQATALRQVASTYPGCAVIVTGRSPASASTLRPVQNALATLRDAGFSGQDAVRIMRVLAAYSMGPDPGADFEFGLDLLLHAIRTLQTGGNGVAGSDQPPVRSRTAPAPAATTRASRTGTASAMARPK